jgi:hypothetical protein
VLAGDSQPVAEVLAGGHLAQQQAAVAHEPALDARIAGLDA